MNEIVQWATIASPIIAVILAWWTSRRGARDAAKVVKSVKELTDAQREITKLKLQKELWDAKTRSSQAFERKKDRDYQENVFNHIGGIHDSFHQRAEENRTLSDNLEFYSQQAKVLQSLLNQLDKK